MPLALITEETALRPPPGLPFPTAFDGFVAFAPTSDSSFPFERYGHLYTLLLQGSHRNARALRYVVLQRILGNSNSILRLLQEQDTNILRLLLFLNPLDMNSFFRD